MTAAGAGSADLPGTISSDPSLSGINAYLQTVLFDAGAPQQFALTQGLRIEIG